MVAGAGARRHPAWPVTASRPITALAGVNHYFTRSKAHWLAKLRRGYPSDVAVRTLAEFDEYDRNEVDDPICLALSACAARGGVWRGYRQGWAEAFSDHCRIGLDPVICARNDGSRSILRRFFPTAVFPLSPRASAVVRLHGAHHDLAGAPRHRVPAVEQAVGGEQGRRERCRADLCRKVAICASSSASRAWRAVTGLHRFLPSPVATHPADDRQTSPAQPPKS